jgi:hypothetical protein
MRRIPFLVVGVILAFGACGDDGAATAGTPRTPSTVDVELTGPSVGVRVTGTLELTADGWVVCPGSVAPCWPVVSNGGADLDEGRVVVEGTWQNETISITSLAAPPAVGPGFVDPCEGDDLGRWNDVAGGPAAIQGSTPHLAGIWLTADQRTLVVVVNDDVEGVRSRLAAQGFEGVCVADLGFEHTLAELTAAQAELADRWSDWSERGWAPLSSSVEVTANRVVASFDEIDQRLRDELAAESWGRLVHVDAAVEVLEGTVDDLATEPSDREIPLATQPRTSAGMGALGSFVLRFDERGDCLWFEADGGARIKPIWPHGTRALRDPVVVFDGRGDPIVAVDHEIQTGGGFGQVLPDSDDPTDCGATEVWVIAPGS